MYDAGTWVMEHPSHVLKPKLLCSDGTPKTRMVTYLNNIVICMDRKQF